MDVSIVFNADTGQYEAKLAGMDAKTAKSAQAVADAKNKILAYHREQIASAVALGKSAEDLERIQSKSAAAMANVTDANANKMIGSIDRLIARHKAMRAEMESSLKIPAVPHQTDVTDRMATSGVVRFSEGTGGIRATENFIASIPGAGVAMQALFPLVGGAGLAGLFVEMGEKGYNAFKKVENAAVDTRNAFQDLHDQSKVRIDDIDLENQRIQDQIDKISGHPNNGMATALLEAKKMADDLVVSLQADRKELEGLLKEHDTGVFGAVLGQIGLAPASNKQTGKDLLNDQSNLFTDLRKASDDRDLATAGIKDPKKLATADDAWIRAVHAAYQKQIDALHTEKERLRKEQDTPVLTSPKSGPIPSGIDNSGKIADVEGRAKQLLDDQTEAVKRAKTFGLNTQLGKVKQDHENAQLGDKAAAKRFKDMEGQAAELEQNGASEKAIYDFWDGNRNAFATGSEQYNQVVEKQASLAKAGAEKVHAAIAAFKKLADREDTPFIFPRNVNVQGNTRESDQRVEETAARNRLAASLQSAQAARTKVEIDRADGSISKLSADQQLAAIAAKEHAERLADLQRQLEQFQKNANSYNPLLGVYTDDKEQERSLELNGEIARERAQQSIDAMKDAAAVAADSWKNALNNAFDQWYQHAKDTAAQVAELFNQTISDTNRNLVDLMSGDYKKGDFKKEGHDLFKSISSDLLQQGEAPLLKSAKDELGKLLGVNLENSKPDGTQSKPFYMKNADGTGSGAPGAVSSLLGLFGGGGTASGIAGGVNGALESAGGLAEMFGSLGTSDAASGIGDAVAGGAGDMVGGITDFLGGFALGGDVPETGIADVGEMGREKVLLPGGSHVIPSNKLGGDTHIHIDAKDSADPAQTEARLHRAIQSYIPGIVGASLAASREQRLRQPSTKR